MYNVIEIKSEIENAVRAAKNKITTQLTDAFIAIYPNNIVPDFFAADSPKIDRVNVSRLSDLKNIYYNEGFYIIFSDYPVLGNSCKLRSGRLQAIYRGECNLTRKRISSHLFHATYKEEYKAREKRYNDHEKNLDRSFYEAFWSHCLKLKAGGISGVDIDNPPYSNYKWLVLVHRMDGSGQEVRKLAELAFDRAFGRPAASREC